MTHTYSKLICHCIWSTKNRQLYITPEIKNRLYGYIRSIIQDAKQELIIINGMPDHVHLLINLSPSITVSDFIKHIKTSSTKWIRSHPVALSDFSWQQGYAAYSVGYSTLKTTIKYIENQEIHHQKISYGNEYIDLLNIQGIPFDPRFVLD